MPPPPKPTRKSLRKPAVYTARRLRREMTPPEVALWRQLRQRPLGLKFRRQHPVRAYVGDFYCSSAKLIIEIDGEAHNRGDQPERDERRYACFIERGFAILRIPAADIIRSSTAVANALSRYAAQPPLHHQPPPSATADGPPPCPGEDEEAS